MDPIVITILWALGVNWYAYESGEAPSMFGEKNTTQVVDDQRTEKSVRIDGKEYNWEK